MTLHWTFNPDEGEARLLAGDHVVGRVYHDPADSLFYHGVVGDEEVYFDNEPFVAMELVESRARLLQSAGADAGDPAPDANGPPQREESFAVEDGFLVRRVAPRRGNPYEHRCPAEAFENVAWAIDDRAEPFTIDDLQAATGLPFTQVAVALAFIKERGCVAPVHGRKHKAASGCIHLDAMTEYHALREEPQP